MNQLRIHYIIEYLTKILDKYTQHGKINIISYFNKIFIKIIDIWGFIMSYIVLYEYLYPSFVSLTDTQFKYMNQLKYIIVHFY